MFCEGSGVTKLVVLEPSLTLALATLPHRRHHASPQQHRANVASDGEYRGLYRETNQQCWPQGYEPGKHIWNNFPERDD